jgi:hypothetical protein
MAKKALPNVPNSQDRQQLQFQNALKELVEVGEGVRGDPLDRKITLRDILGSGIGRLKPGANAANTAGGNGLLPGFDNEPDMRTPPKPTGVTATSGLGTVFINWDTPRYGYHGFTRLYRSGDDNFANSTVIGVASGSMYVDNLHGNEVDPATGQAQGYYYWVAFVSEMGVEGPPHDANGIYGAPSMDPEYMLQVLQNSITESQLSKDLNTRLTETDETIIEQKEQINGLSASFTVKVDANGRVAGYGLASEPNESGSNTSSFVINADRFAIFHPGAKEQLAFGVEAGKTVMDGAYIKSASIKSASIESLAANKIVADNLSAISANMGTITTGRLQSVDNRVAIDMTQGTFSVRSGTAGARMEMNDNVIKVYDENGVLRVKLGNLAA